MVALGVCKEQTFFSGIQFWEMYATTPLTRWLGFLNRERSTVFPFPSADEQQIFPELKFTKAFSSKRDLLFLTGVVRALAFLFSPTAFRNKRSALRRSIFQHLFHQPIHFHHQTLYSFHTTGPRHRKEQNVNYQTQFLMIELWQFH